MVQEARQIFAKFKEICPNSAEKFDPTQENVVRWVYHIRAHEERQKYTRFELGSESEVTNATAFAASRIFWTFDEMPKYMQQHYLTLADLFAGHQVIATGSRVNGTYIDIFSGEMVQAMRRILHKSQKVESDYDFFVVGVHPSQHGVNLPKWADFLPYLLPNQRSVFVPMWDFSRLPETEHAKVLELIDENDWYELVKIHDHYQLSPNKYCCDLAPVQKWFLWWKENK